MKINVKTSFIGAILLAFVSLSSCDKVKDAIQADINYTAATITFPIEKIPDGPYTEKKLAGSDNLSALDLSKYSGIKSIHVKSIKVKLKNGDENSNFKSLKKVQIKIVSGSKEALLASYTNESFNDLYEIDIPVTGTEVDLKSFVTSNFSYELLGEAKAPTAKKVDAELVAEYTLKFGL